MALVAGAAVGTTVLASVLAAAPEGGPTRAQTLLAVLALPRRAARIEAAARVGGSDAAVVSFPAVALPLYFDALRLGRWRVGIQAGHWKADELPTEQAHLRDSTGAVAGAWREVDVNLRIARLAADILARRGVTVDLLPATVPAGYEADAFVAIHADGGGSGERGWKIAAPWRSSEASRILADEVRASYGRLSGLPEDRYGVTYLMHGYYGFSWNRYRHASAAWTPSIIIETGYLTSPLDRELLVGDPQRAAEAISIGVLMFLGREAALPPRSFVPMLYPPMLVAASEATLHKLPGAGEPTVGAVAGGTIVRPLDEENGWFEVMVWGNYRRFGWIPGSQLEPEQ